MPIPLAPIIGAGAVALGQGIASWVSKRNTDKTIKANKEQAKYAYDQQKEMVAAQNEYNSPASQMGRYSEAGLNPHLIYSQGNPGNQATIPQYQAPRAEYKYASPVNLPAMLSTYQDVAMKDAQTDNIRAQTENTEARTAVELIEKRLRGAKSEVATQYGLDNAAADLELKRQALTNAEKEAVGKDLRNEFQRYANQWAKYGITGKDALIIRSGIKIMQQLGIDSSWLIEMLPKGTSLESILNMNE